MKKIIKIYIIIFICSILFFFVGVIGKSTMENSVTYCDFKVSSRLVNNENNEYDTYISYSCDNHSSREFKDLVYTLILETEDGSKQMETKINMPFIDSTSGLSYGTTIVTDGDYEKVVSAKHNSKHIIYTNYEVEKKLKTYTSIKKIFGYTTLGLMAFPPVFFMFLTILVHIYDKKHKKDIPVENTNTEDINVTPSVEIKKESIKFVRCPYCNTKNKSSNVKCSSCGGNL